MSISGPTKPNRTGVATANDSVMTPPFIAKKIVGHFNPTGKILEPCRGNGSFLNLMPSADWCEITHGRDFFDWHKPVDWIITNPPFSIYDRFLLHAFEVADNIVFLTVLSKVFKSRKMDNALIAYGGIKEVVMLGGGGAVGFPFGFPVGCVHFKRGYDGDIKIVRKYDWKAKRSGWESK